MPSLGHDLATIRENRGISLTEIQQSTKIPSHILAAIEDDSIFSDMGNGSTYIRSYVRTYAKALAIEDRKIIYALNKAEKGGYAGSLIDDEERSDEAPPRKDEEEDQKEPQPDAKNEQQEQTAKPPQEPPPATKQPDSSVLDSEDIHSVDWANLGSQFQPAKSSKNKKKISIIVAVVLLIAAAFLIYWFFFMTQTPTTGSSTGSLPAETTGDSDQLNTVALTDGDSVLSTAESSSSDGLADTLAVVVYAAYDKLEPIRVYTDLSDELNPYWIDQGEAIAFKFVNSFQFRGKLEHLILLLNGHRISNLKEQFYNAETGRIELSRSFFEKSSKWSR